MPHPLGLPPRVWKNMLHPQTIKKNLHEFQKTKTLRKKNKKNVSKSDTLLRSKNECFRGVGGGSSSVQKHPFAPTLSSPPSIFLVLFSPFSQHFVIGDFHHEPAQKPKTFWHTRVADAFPIGESRDTEWLNGKQFKKNESRILVLGKNMWGSLFFLKPDGREDSFLKRGGDLLKENTRGAEGIMNNPVGTVDESK